MLPNLSKTYIGNKAIIPIFQQYGPTGKRMFFLCFVLFTCGAYAQKKEILYGRINNQEAQDIHVLNTTQNIGTVTTGSGNFSIPAKNSDTIIFSAINLKPFKLIVTDRVLDVELNISLDEKIIELDGVTLNPYRLTGSLSKDVSNIPKPLTAESLNLPNASKIILTQSERKLYEADNGNFIELYGSFPEAGIAINLHKILNWVSGRTKNLKKLVKSEEEERMIAQLHAKYKHSFPELSESETYLMALKECYGKMDPAK